MSDWKVFPVKTFVDERGALTPLELKEFIDFDIKRIYTVHDNKMLRGGHSHIVEEELFMVVSGFCTARIHDGSSWQEVLLEANKQAMYVGKGVWHEFDNFSDGCVLLALSSTNYNPAREDYIEDFEEFINLKQK